MFRLDRQHDEESLGCHGAKVCLQTEGHSLWSELNKERCRRLEKLGRMTAVGRAVLPDLSPAGFVVDPEALNALRAERAVWETFMSFSPLYQRVRIDTMQRKKKRPEVFRRRLAKLIENTRNGVMYGDWNDNGRLLGY